MSPNFLNMILGQQDPIKKLLPPTDEDLRWQQRVKGDFKTAQNIDSPDKRKREAAKAKARKDAQKTPAQKVKEQNAPVKAKMQAERGGRSIAETNKQTKGTYEHSVEVARSVLGIKPGSPDDALLKSAVYMNFYQEGVDDQPQVRTEDLNAVIRKFRTSKESLAKDVETYKARRGGNTAQIAEKPKPQTLGEAFADRSYTKDQEAWNASGVGGMLKSMDDASSRMSKDVQGVGDVVGGAVGLVNKDAGAWVKDNLPKFLSDANPFLALGRGIAHTFGSLEGAKMGDPILSVQQAGLAGINLADAFSPMGYDVFKALKASKGLAETSKLAQEAGVAVEDVNKWARQAMKEDVPKPKTETVPEVAKAEAPKPEILDVQKPVEPVKEPTQVKTPEVSHTPAKTNPGVKGPTAIAHADTKQIRDVMGFDPYVKSKKKLPELIEESKTVNVRAVVDELSKKVRPLTDKEQAAMAVHVVESSGKARKLAEDMARAVDSGDVDSAAKLSSEIEVLNDDIIKAVDASDKAGSEMGRAFVARKLTIQNSDEPWALMYRHFKATGKKSSPEFDKLVGEVESLKKQVEDLRAKDYASERTAAEKTFNRVNGAKPVNYRRSTTKQGYENAVKVWQKGGINQTKNRGAALAPSEEQWKALKYIAKYHFDNGVENFADAVNRVMEATGVDELLATRAVRASIVDDSRLANIGRTEGEEFMSRGANAVESPDVRKLRFLFDKKKAEANAYLLKAEKDAAFRQKHWAQKSIAVLADASGTARTLLSSGDLSAPLRQGAAMWWAQPKKSAKAMLDMFKSIGEKGYEKTMWEITQSAHYNEAVSAKLALTDAVSGILPHEEAFVSNLLKDVPGIQQLTGASERTYTAYLNSVRMQAFSAYIDLLESSGKKLNRADLESLANWVNIATGRGNLGRVEKDGDSLAKIFFSPRYLMSRFQFLSATPVLKATPKTRALIAKEWAKPYLAMALTVYLGSKAGIMEGDGRSSKWGKIKIGDNLYDVTGGMGSIVTFGSRMASYIASMFDEDVSVRKTYGDKYTGRKDPFSDPGRMTENFVLGKSAPLPRAIYYGVKKKDFKGDDTNIGKEIGMSFVPIGVQQAVSRRGQSPADQVAAFIAEFFGVGTTDARPDPKPKKK